ncbi:hypothetical protein [Actinophytocola xinjiangensis]|nr:hypothetical protein [Actinophytocola xinjiangensis]
MSVLLWLGERQPLIAAATEVGAVLARRAGTADHDHNNPARPQPANRGR